MQHHYQQQQPVTSTRVQGWGDEPPNGVGGVWGGEHPPHTGLRLSERRATNIGLLYPKVRNNIGEIFPLTSPQPKYWVDVSPASPAGLTLVAAAAAAAVGSWHRFGFTEAPCYVTAGRRAARFTTTTPS